MPSHRYVPPGEVVAVDGGGFAQRVALTLHELHDEVADVERQRQALIDHRSRLTKALAALRAVERGAEAPVADRPVQTTAAAITTVLADTGQEMSQVAIREELAQRGWTPRTKNVPHLLRVTLHRLSARADSGVVRIHDGIYAYRPAESP